MSTYTGIDYGQMAPSNRDANGIHYGVISQNSVQSEALDDIYHGSDSRDIGFENWQRSTIQELRDALRGVLEQCASTAQANRFVDCAIDAIESDLGELYESDDSHDFFYERNGYEIVQCLDNDLFVLASPFYTHAQFCSPCVPGAGNLDSPCDSGPKTFCLGHDFFDGGKAPYTVRSVANGSVVQPNTLVN